MAHLSGDKTLIAAFQNGEDVHRRTAAEVFGTAPENVSSEQRRYAKTINFGLIYGMGQYGLANHWASTTFPPKTLSTATSPATPASPNTCSAPKNKLPPKATSKPCSAKALFARHPQQKRQRPRRSRARRHQCPMQGTASDLIKRAMIDVRNCLSEASIDVRHPKQTGHAGA